MYDPFADEPLESVETSERSRRAGDSNYYVWKGLKLPRVTTILGTCASESLCNWHGKTAALSAAAHLVHAGLFVPDVDDPIMAELEKYVDNQPMRQVTESEAIAAACHWQWNMREAHRYRDHKGRIGAIFHHAMFERALGIWDGKDVLGQAMRLAESPTIWAQHQAALSRMLDLGKTPEQVYTDLAHHSVPYIDEGLWFLDTFKPEILDAGLECMVINTGEEYAGTKDVDLRFTQANWEAAGYAWPFLGQRSAVVTGDWKTSNYLSDTTRYQLAAYARSSFIGMPDDESEHPILDVDGIMAIHVKPGERKPPRTWVGRDKIDAFFDVFCAMNFIYRSLSNLPRANAARAYTGPAKPKQLKRGERPCPI